jgi:hypothetical protein
VQDDNNNARKRMGFLRNAEAWRRPSRLR